MPYYDAVRQQEESAHGKAGCDYLKQRGDQIECFYVVGVPVTQMITRYSKIALIPVFAALAMWFGGVWVVTGFTYQRE